MTIIELRAKHNLRQRDIASYCGVSIVTVQNWERKLGKPTDERIKKLSELFAEHGEFYEG